MRCRLFSLTVGIPKHAYREMSKVGAELKSLIYTFTSLWRFMEACVTRDP